MNLYQGTIYRVNSFASRRTSRSALPRDTFASANAVGLSRRAAATLHLSPAQRAETADSRCRYVARESSFGELTPPSEAAKKVGRALRARLRCLEGNCVANPQWSFETTSVAQPRRRTPISNRIRVDQDRRRPFNRQWSQTPFNT